MRAPLPTGTYAAPSGGSWPRLDRVGDLDGQRARAGRDPRVLAVDEQPGADLARRAASDASRAASKSCPTWTTVAPSARIRSSLRRFARSSAKTVTGTPKARPAYAAPWPKLPVEATTSGSVRTQRPLPHQLADRVPRAAALERADRVDRLDLDDDRSAGSSRQALVDELRARREGRVDRARGRPGSPAGPSGSSDAAHRADHATGERAVLGRPARTASRPAGQARRPPRPAPRRRRCPSRRPRRPRARRPPSRPAEAAPDAFDEARDELRPVVADDPDADAPGMRRSTPRGAGARGPAVRRSRARRTRSAGRTWRTAGTCRRRRCSRAAGRS